MHNHDPKSPNYLEQSNVTTKNLVEPSFVLINLSEMASPQGLLLTLKSEQEVMQSFEKMVKQKESILDFRHVRALQGGIEVDLFVMSSLPSSLPSNPPSAAKSQESPPDQTGLKEIETSRKPNQTRLKEIETSRDIIQKTVNQIFQYKNFYKEQFLSKSYLQELVIVKQALATFAWERRMYINSLSNRHKALNLRNFLITCLDQDLCPHPGNKLPKNLSKVSPRIRNEWIQYFILRSQYVDGESRRQVERELQRAGCWIGGGTYARYVKVARQNLSTIIWEKEIQARK